MLRVSKKRRPFVRQAAAVLFQLSILPTLPSAVARFYLLALVRAARSRDQWSIDVATRPRELRFLLRAVHGRQNVVEVGTASGWTALALALAEPTRRVLSVDVVERPERDRYVDLVSPATRERIQFVVRRGEDGPASPVTVDALFLDGAHEREATMAAFLAWRPSLTPDAVVAFHDWHDPDYPGVDAAIAGLRLPGVGRGHLFVTRVADHPNID